MSTQGSDGVATEVAGRARTGCRDSMTYSDTCGCPVGMVKRIIEMCAPDVAPAAGAAVSYSLRLIQWN